MNPVADNVRRLRHKRGLTQTALARQALVTPANLCAIEAGRRDLTVGTLIRIARALDVDPGHLFGTPSRRTSLGRVPLDFVARAVVTGSRQYSTELGQLADGLAWRCRPVLDAHRASGTRRASKAAWSKSTLVWDPGLLARLQEKIHRYAGSSAWSRP